MPKPCIGISENEFKATEEKILKIEGTGFKRQNKPDPTVAFTSGDHNWAVTIYDVKNKYILVGVTPTPKVAAKKAKYGSDDLTVTLTFDENLSTEFELSIICEEVDVEPGP